jgi:hypothetical protein
VAGGVVAAIAAMRASQVSARAPLAAKIHALGITIDSLRAALEGRGDFDSRMQDFQVAWTDLIVHQKILLASWRMNLLATLAASAMESPELTPDERVSLASKAMNTLTEMAAEHSRHLFRWRTRIGEWRVGRRFRGRVRFETIPEHLQGFVSEVGRPWPSWMLYDYQR